MWHTAQFALLWVAQLLLLSQNLRETGHLLLGVGELQLCCLLSPAYALRKTATQVHRVAMAHTLPSGGKFL